MMLRKPARWLGPARFPCSHEARPLSQVETQNSADSPPSPRASSHCSQTHSEPLPQLAGTRLLCSALNWQLSSWQPEASSPPPYSYTSFPAPTTSSSPQGQRPSTRWSVQGQRSSRGIGAELWKVLRGDAQGGRGGGLQKNYWGTEQATRVGACPVQCYMPPASAVQVGRAQQGAAALAHMAEALVVAVDESEAIHCAACSARLQLHQVNHALGAGRGGLRGRGRAFLCGTKKRGSSSTTAARLRWAEAAVTAALCCAVLRHAALHRALPRCARLPTWPTGNATGVMLARARSSSKLAVRRPSASETVMEELAALSRYPASSSSAGCMGGIELCHCISPPQISRPRWIMLKRWPGHRPKGSISLDVHRVLRTSFGAALAACLAPTRTPACACSWPL